jgi:hypothetical protein
MSGPCGLLGSLAWPNRMGRLLPQGHDQPRPWQPQSGDLAHPAANERGGGALVPFFYQGGTGTQCRRPAAGMVVALRLPNGQWRGNCTHKLGKESSTMAPKKRGWKRRGLRGGGGSPVSLRREGNRRQWSSWQRKICGRRRA